MKITGFTFTPSYAIGEKLVVLKRNGIHLLLPYRAIADLKGLGLPAANPLNKQRNDRLSRPRRTDWAHHPTKLRQAMKPKETDICLNRDDMKCLERGGSIEYKIMDGDHIAAVVKLSIERESKGFRGPTNSAEDRRVEA